MCEKGKGLELDIVAINYPKTFDATTKKNFGAAIKQIFADWGCDVHVLLLEEGMDISIIKKDDFTINLIKKKE